MSKKSSALDKMTPNASGKKKTSCGSLCSLLLANVTSVEKLRIPNHSNSCTCAWEISRDERCVSLLIAKSTTELFRNQDPFAAADPTKRKELPRETQQQQDPNKASTKAIQ